MSPCRAFFYTFISIAIILGLILLGIGVGIFQYANGGANQVGFLSSISYIGIGLVPIAIWVSIYITNRFGQIIYVIVLCVIIVVQFVIGYILINSQNTVALNLANGVDEAWERELNVPGSMVVYEEMFKCCGRASPQDYILIRRPPPAMCFKDHQTSIPQNLITMGCRSQVEDYSNLLLLISNIIMCSQFCLQVFSIFSYCCVCREERSPFRSRY